MFYKIFFILVILIQVNATDFMQSIHQRNVDSLTKNSMFYMEMKTSNGIVYVMDAEVIDTWAGGLSLKNNNQEFSCELEDVISPAVNKMADYYGNKCGVDKEAIIALGKEAKSVYSLLGIRKGKVIRVNVKRDSNGLYSCAAKAQPRPGKTWVLNDEMIERGYAFAGQYASKKHIALEEAAEEKKWGLWENNSALMSCLKKNLTGRE